MSKETKVINELLSIETESRLLANRAARLRKQLEGWNSPVAPSGVKKEDAGERFINSRRKRLMKKSIKK